MARNPFKGQEFLGLFEEWNSILRRHGHDEIEDFTLPDAPLKVWHNFKWNKQYSSEAYASTRDYYSAANALLETYSFRLPLHKRIWALHCEGLSVRKIAIKLRQRKLTKTTVHVVIVEIQTRSGLKRER